MECQNKKFQDFCVKFANDIPFCDAISKVNCYSALELEVDAGGTLLNQCFELRELFLEKKIIKFRALGNCMYPCVRQGDVLHIEHKKAKDIKVGEVVAYQRFGRLFGHRTIDKGIQNGLSYIVTRPDTSKNGDDGPSFDDQIVGVISSVERKGVTLSTKKSAYSGLNRIGIWCFLKLNYCKCSLNVLLFCFLNYIQKFSAYRRIAKFLFFKKKQKMSFSIHVPLNVTGKSKFIKEISPEELIELNQEIDRQSISQWKMLLNIDAHPIASLLFIFKPDSCKFSGWWLASAQLMVRYRGTSIEDELLTKVKELLKLSGITRVKMCAFKDKYIQKMMINTQIADCV